jgi:hypothetical protein
MRKPILNALVFVSWMAFGVHPNHVVTVVCFVPTLVLVDKDENADCTKIEYSDSSLLSSVV